MTRKTVVIGVGNEYRGDDGVGLVVVRALDGKLPAGVEVVVQTGEATALMNAWVDATHLILIDAVAAQGTPGKTYRIDASETPLPVELFSRSTHDFGVATAIELARALGQLPPHVVVYGIEGQNFSAGAQLLPSVERAVDEVVSLVLAEVQAIERSTE